MVPNLVAPYEQPYTKAGILDLLCRVSTTTAVSRPGLRSESDLYVAWDREKGIEACGAYIPAKVLCDIREDNEISRCSHEATGRTRDFPRRERYM
jgi:hypothetical protein